MANRKHLIILIFLIGVSISLLYSVFVEVNQQTIEELHNEQEVHAKQSATGLKIFFENYETILGYLAKTSNVIEMNESGKSSLFNLYLSHSNEIKAVTRIDSTGKVIFTAPNDIKILGRDISYQKHVRQLLNERRPVLSDVFHAIQGYRAVAFYVPVYNGSTFIGGLAVLIPFDELTGKYVREIRIREHGFSWVVSNEGTILYYPDPELTDKPVSKVISDSSENAALLRSLSGKKSGKLAYKGLMPDKTIKKMHADFQSIKVTDKFWSIIVSTPQDEVSRKMRGFIIKWFSIFSLILGLAAYYIYYTGKARTIIKEEAKRRKAEEALINSEKKFRTLVEVIPDGIFLLDRSGRILTCNPKANELLGNYSQDRNFFGKNINDMIAPEDKAKTSLAFEKSQNNGVTKNLECTFLRSDGTRFWAEISIASITVKDGKKENFTAVLRDITDRKQNEKAIIEAKEKAERSDRLKSEFLAQMSHEIRSPINSILSFTSLIKDELIDRVSEDLKMSFSIIENAGKRIIRTIGLILNMSEIQTGSFEVSLRKINLIKDILDKIILEYRQSAKDKNLELLFQNKTGSNDVNIFADEYTIGQIFSNLIDNAIKYTEMGQVILTVFCTNKNEIVVEVCDSGIGISQEYIPNLFSPFSQEEQGYTRRYEGNGLGLALVKKYCDLNNLKIEVESKKGVGSAFRVFFNVSK